MPGEADRLKKENEELREENEELKCTVATLTSQADNQSEKIGWDAATIKQLHRRIRELEALTPKEKVTVVGPFWSDSASTTDTHSQFRSVPVEEQKREELEGRVGELEGRMDQLAAAYDAWDLMRDNHTSRLGSLERQVHELTIEVGRLRNDERRWWQR